MSRLNMLDTIEGSISRRWESEEAYGCPQMPTSPASRSATGESYGY
jgi:hypothetical protein